MITVIHNSYSCLFKPGKEKKYANELRRSLSKDETAITSPLMTQKIFVLAHNHASLITAWTSTPITPSVPKMRILSNDERRDSLQHLCSTFNAKELYRPKSWVKIICGIHKNSIGYVHKILNKYELQILVKPSQHQKAHIRSNPVHKEHTSTSQTSNKHFPELTSLTLRAFEDIQPIQPNIFDVKQFYGTGVDLTSFTNKVLSNVGDKIELISGSFSTLLGTIIYLTPKTAVVEIHDNSDPDAFWTTDAHFHEFRRQFAIGQQVKEVAGITSGQIGTVLHVSGNDVTIMYTDPFREA